MIKSTLTSALILGLMSAAVGQIYGQAAGQQGGNPLGNLMGTLDGRQGQQPGLLGGLNSQLGSLLNGQQRPSMNGAGMMQQQQMMQQGGPLGNLLQQLQNLPQRGMQMVNQMLANVRNMLPGGGLGRANGSMQQMGSNMSPQGLNLQGLTAPLSELTQGRLPNLSSLSSAQPNGQASLTQNLPNLSQLTQQGSQAADRLVPGLGRTLSSVLPAGGNAVPAS